MKDFSSFIRCLFSGVFYGSAILSLVLWIVRGETYYGLRLAICLALALLIDILDELKKFNDKNK